MKRLSTRCAHNFETIGKDHLKETGGNPSKQTMDFLAQFARVYQVEKVLEDGINSYIMN